MEIYKKLLGIQIELKAPKSQFNAFGKYSYRSCEDILEALKPLLNKYQSTLMMSDEVILIGDRYYIQATAKLIDTETGEMVESKALAREDDSKKGQDLAQLTGSTSSYARKYALNGLFSIDDNKDSDFTNKHGKEEIKPNMTPTELKIENKWTNTKSENNDYVITEKQLKRLITIGNNAGITYETIKAQVKKEFGIEPKELKKSQYDGVVSRLEAKANK